MVSALNVKVFLKPRVSFPNFTKKQIFQTKKHWHFYRKSASHKGGIEEAQLKEMFGAILVLPQA
jgi:hypothetical protein